MLWEIFVPTRRNPSDDGIEGKPFRTRHHKAWDEKVRRIANGLTVFHPSKGSWKDVNGTLYIDRVIPVRIACNREQIKAIMKMTAVHYSQIDVMAYKISDEVIFLSDKD